MTTAGAIIAGTLPKGDTLGRRAWRRFRASRLNIICVVIIAAYLLLALLGYTGMVPDFQQQVGAKFSPPDLHKPALWLGTDLFGRSILYKLFAGAKTAMTLGLLVACISLPLGLFMGAVAGYFGGKIDAIVQWVYSGIVSVPYILLIIAISYILGKGMLAICVAMGVVGWVGLCRMTRAEFMKLREREFVLASRLLGASDFRLIFRHILPNVMHIALVAASMEIMGAIKAEVILTFLGVGVQDGASWGQMISDAPGELMIGVWWPTVGVSFTLFLIVFALNRVGDALRDALDPRLV
jgi:ABC-type dipeptide/oligopeptide/nickel transport system permease subunit